MTFLKLLKETAMRSGEAKRLHWTDIDRERRIITLNDPEKGNDPRAWKVSAELIGMLKCPAQKEPWGLQRWPHQLPQNNVSQDQKAIDSQAAEPTVADDIVPHLPTLESRHALP